MTDQTEKETQKRQARWQVEAPLRRQVPMRRRNIAMASGPTQTADLDKYHDDQGLRLFTRFMRDKLEKKRHEGRGGWWQSDCLAMDLAKMLREHLPKGDPVDVGNFAMMLFNRAEGPAALKAVFADLAEAPDDE